MNHEQYADSGADDMMVLLDRCRDIATDIACSQIDDMMLIPSSPDMRATEVRHMAMFQWAH